MEIKQMVEQIEDFIVDNNVPDAGIIWISGEWYDELEENAFLSQKNAYSPCIIYEGRVFKRDESLKNNQMRYGN